MCVCVRLIGFIYISLGLMEMPRSHKICTVVPPKILFLDLCCIIQNIKLTKLSKCTEISLESNETSNNTLQFSFGLSVDLYCKSFSSTGSVKTQNVVLESVSLTHC